MVSRRDALKIGASFVVGLGLGAGLASIISGRPSAASQSGTTTSLSPPTSSSATQTGQRKEVFKLGVVTFQTGPASIFGVPALNAAQLLVDEINKAGGILGAQIQLVVRTRAGGPDKMVAVYKELVQQVGVDAYIGAYIERRLSRRGARG